MYMSTSVALSAQQSGHCADAQKGPQWGTKSGTCATDESSMNLYRVNGPGLIRMRTDRLQQQCEGGALTLMRREQECVNISATLREYLTRGNRLWSRM